MEFWHANEKNLFKNFLERTILKNIYNEQEENKNAFTTLIVQEAFTKAIPRNSFYF